MRLKQIEISGFKSFADRTVIEFNDGLTAVVGPNGSGKSNITEAIRWVLGEQSAKSLRGGKMPDVIFAGSSSRSPLNLAEVTLVLDNEEGFLPIDFSEVSVTRRLNRNGDSDFFINKQPCRLKDIVNLFMDSGLGKESFSIISQGKVEAIFNSKPEDRRGIFEEAAGVLKYKTRKKEAERKLLTTEDNLSRVQDIIYELEVQLAPLKEQRDKARRYLSLKGDLEAVEVSVLVSDIESHKEQWEAKKIELNQRLRVLQDKQALLTEKETVVSACSEEREQLERDIDGKQQVLLSVMTRLEKLEGQKQVLEEKKRFSNQTKSSNQETLNQLAMTTAALTTDRKSLEETQQKLGKERHVLTQRISQLSKELERLSKSTKEQLEDLRRDYVEVMQQQTNVNNDLKHLEKQYQQETARNQGDMDKFHALIQEEASDKEQLLLLKVAYEEKKTEVSQLVSQYKQEQGQHQRLKKQNQQLDVQLMDALKILQQGQAKQKSLKELQANYAGFYQGVRSVLKEKEQIGGIVGAVAELTTVPDEFQVAIETALGAAAQHVITEDENSARQAIAYLKKQRLGRATFLPLTTIKPRQLPSRTIEQLKEVSGFVGVASDLVTYDPNISQVIQNILGLTLVAVSLADANRLARDLQFKYRVVSLDGDVMNPGGSMTGGATKNGQSMHWFSQTNELKELEKQITQMTVLYKGKEKESLALKEQISSLDETLEHLRQTGEAARLDEQRLGNNVEQVSTRLSQLEKERRSFEYEKKELQRFLTAYETDKERLELEQQSLEARRLDLDKLMSQTGKQEEENQALKEQTLETHSKLTAEQAVLDEKLNQLIDKIKETDVRLLELTARSQRLTEQLTEASTEQGTYDMTQEEVSGLMSDLRQEQADVSEALQAHREQREALYARIRELEQDVTGLHQEIKELLTEKVSLEVAKNRHEDALDQSLVYLKEEYELTFEAGKEQQVLLEDVAASRQHVRQLKQDISQLGVVNLESVVQYEEVDERYRFLTSQRDDLNVAKEELFETMSDMDEQVIQKFHEVFCDIREEFRIVFPNMFGGGHADLILTDPMDLLHTGIDIVAQPPGKKLQQLSLLSGGERALTAIALLFAIIQARPVPFCVLDEVEAALDDANVARFGHYLRHFGDATQFIVITHRKGTMEAANVLYGVTMQESGVSKIVSVHLEELEKEFDNVT